ncbi:MAG: hypothetical protein KC592_19190, partial [Nitrospira sp.]|nr:hypothetical protein [Nitrospira sp.]
TLYLGRFSPPILPGDQRNALLRITDEGDPHFCITEYILSLQQDRMESAWDSNILGVFSSKSNSDT